MDKFEIRNGMLHLNNKDGAFYRCAEVDAEIEHMRGYVSALRKDAERYRWLRLQDWDSCPLVVVANPKDAIKLGHDAPSRERLDTMIDAHVAEVQGFLNGTIEAMLGDSC